MKRKILIKLTKLLIILSLVTTGLSLLFYFWLTNDWKSYVSEKEMKAAAGKINHSAPLPSRFRNVYRKVYPDKLTSGVTRELFMKVFYAIINVYRNKYDCACDDLPYLDRTLFPNLSSQRDIFKYFKLGYGLEKYSSPEKCREYALRLQHEHEMRRLRQGYSFEGKNMENLDEKDIVDWLVAEKAPIHYSPRRNPENYSARKETIEKKLND